jgi:hypothetical protein
MRVNHAQKLQTLQYVFIVVVKVVADKSLFHVHCNTTDQLLNLGK